MARGGIRSRLDEHMNSEIFCTSVEWLTLCDFYMGMCCDFEDDFNYGFVVQTMF